MGSYRRSEVIEELNDELDSLSPIQCRNFFSRVAIIDLVEILAAIKKAKKDVAGHSNDEHTHSCVRCDHQYTPSGDNENCPKCQCDGTPPPAGAIRVWQKEAYTFSYPGDRMYSTLLMASPQYWNGTRWQNSEPA